MGKYFCQCLNVAINIKSTDLSTNVQKPNLGHSLNDEFFNGNVTEVQLGLEGISYVYVALVRKRQVGDWLLHHCICCDNTTHAAHTLPGSPRLLVNRQILCDSSVAEALTQSQGYCPLYRLIIPTCNDNQPVSSLALQSDKYSTMQSVLGDIQQQLNTFLVQEEQAMEERIKNYMATQRSSYADLQSKVRQHKNTLVNMILTSEHRGFSESPSDAITDNPTSLLSSEELTGSEVEPVVPQQAKRQSAFGASQDGLPTSKTKKPAFHVKTSSGLSQAVQHQQVSTMDPDGELDFDCAFQEDNNQPFYTSDEETEDTDDSENEYHRGGRISLSSKKNVYSTSVPISVPMWGGRGARKSFAEDLTEEDILPADDEAMAASIKALAQSVHGDGTEMFGELPRPRLNTSNFNL